MLGCILILGKTKAANIKLYGKCKPSLAFTKINKIQSQMEVKRKVEVNFKVKIIARSGTQVQAVRPTFGVSVCVLSYFHRHLCRKKMLH